MGDNWMALMSGRLQGDPKPVSKQRPDTPPALEAVVLVGMRGSPEGATKSADELMADLARLDTLDPAALNPSPEKPMGSLAVGGGGGLFSKMFRNRGG